MYVRYLMTITKCPKLSGGFKNVDTLGRKKYCQAFLSIGALILLTAGKSHNVNAILSNHAMISSRNNNSHHGAASSSTTFHDEHAAQYNGSRRIATPLRSSSSLTARSSSLLLHLPRGGAATTLLAPGTVAALLSPLSSALGFMFWDDNWHGSAFALNLVKNVVAGVFFYGTLAARGAVPHPWRVGASTMSSLAVSALLGVVVGDCTAIASLRRLGSRRYLLVDCLKPALSVLVGVVAFQERLDVRSVLGIASIVTGVYVASVQQVESSGGAAHGDDTGVAVGYAFAVGHLVFDTIGAAITKQCMEQSTAAGAVPLGPLAVGFLRFGSAAIMLYVIGIVAKVTAFVTNSSSDTASSSSQWWSLPKTINVANNVDATATVKSAASNDNTIITNKMTRGNWEAIVVGTFFVTFLGPTLFYRSLQYMTLGVGVTLSCTAPLYEPILSRIMKGTKVNGKAVFGALLAILGVAMLML